MALFIWKDEYSVNVKKIDDQHKKLVSTLNDLHSSMLGAKGKETLGKILDDLIEYTKYHFKTEEDYMRDCKYPKYEEHKSCHNDLAGKVLAFQEEFKSGKKLITVELLFFLKDWISNHINGMDKMYSKCLNDNGIL